MGRGPMQGGPLGAQPIAVAARAAVIVAYAVALVGAAAATIALRDGQIATGVLVLTTSLGVAALLAATGTLLRGLRDLEHRLARIEDVLLALRDR